MGGELTTIGEIAQVFDGPHATPKKIDSGPIFLSITSLRNGRLDLTQSARLSERDFAKWTRRVTPEAGDIVFLYETRLGEAAIIPGNLRCCLGRRMGLLRVDRGKVNPQYLLYAFLSPEFQETIRSRTVHGSTTERIALREFPDFPIRLIPLEEQQQVTQVLSTIDRKIDLNHHLNTVLEQTAQAIFHSWFVAFDPVRAKGRALELGCDPERAAMGALSGKLRVPANVEELEAEDFHAAEERLEELSEQRKELAETAGLFPSALVESEVGLVPEGWGVIQAGSLIDNIRNQVDPTTLDLSLPYVGLEHIGRKSLTLRDWGISTEVESNKSRFDSGNVLFGKLRPYFHKVCVAPFSGICSTDILVLAAREKEYAGFATHLIFTEGFVEFANRASTGTRMPRAKWAHMRTFPVCCPSVEVARRFNAMQESASRLSASLVEEAAHLRDLRDTLLPRLISGELSVEGPGG